MPVRSTLFDFYYQLLFVKCRLLSQRIVDHVLEPVAGTTCLPPSPPHPHPSCSAQTSRSLTWDIPGRLLGGTTGAGSPTEQCRHNKHVCRHSISHTVRHTTHSILHNVRHNAHNFSHTLLCASHTACAAVYTVWRLLSVSLTEWHTDLDSLVWTRPCGQSVAPSRVGDEWRPAERRSGVGRTGRGSVGVWGSVGDGARCGACSVAMFFRRRGGLGGLS